MIQAEAVSVQRLRSPILRIVCHCKRSVVRKSLCGSWFEACPVGGQRAYIYIDGRSTANYRDEVAYKISISSSLRSIAPI